MSVLDDILRDAPGMGWGGTGNYDQCKADIKELILAHLKVVKDICADNRVTDKATIEATVDATIKQVKEL